MKKKTVKARMKKTIEEANKQVQTLAISRQPLEEGELMTVCGRPVRMWVVQIGSRNEIIFSHQMYRKARVGDRVVIHRNDAGGVVQVEKKTSQKTIEFKNTMTFFDAPMARRILLASTTADELHRQHKRVQASQLEVEMLSIRDALVRSGIVADAAFIGPSFTAHENTKLHWWCCRFVQFSLHNGGLAFDWLTTYRTFFETPRES